MKTRCTANDVTPIVALATLLVAVGCGGETGAAPRADSPDPYGARFETTPSSVGARAPAEAEPVTSEPFPGWNDREGPECTYIDPEWQVDLFRAYSQAHIDALASCEVITGALWIESGDELDLRPLSKLRAVGSLYVFGYSDNVTPVGIPSLEGLENLQRVRWSVTLGSLPITTLAPLRNLRGPEVAEEVPFQLLIDNCDYLETLGELDMGEDVGLLGIQANDRLTSLDGLRFDTPSRRLVAVGLGENPRLLDLDVFETVTELEGLGLSFAPQQDLSAFASLRRIRGRLDLFNNGALEAISLPNLESVGTISFAANPALAELELPALREITDELEITFNPLLPSSSVDPLRALAPFADITGNRDDPPAP